MSEESAIAGPSASMPAEGTAQAADADKTPSKYSPLKRNVFIERRLRYSADYTAICHCEPSSGCDENCLNRAMNYLCGKQCPCGDACTNGSLALRKEKQSRVAWTGEGKGWGLVAAEEIKEGEFVIDFRGEVVSMGTYQTRVKTLYANKKDYYALPYDVDEVIDAGLRGNDARFINHSCSPNVELRKYQTMGMASEEYELGFWALRDVKGGEEITFNYALEMFPTAEKTLPYAELFETLTGKRPACSCGSTVCTGTLGQPQAKLTLKVGKEKEPKGRKGKGKKGSAAAAAGDETEKRAGAGKGRNESASRFLPPSVVAEAQPEPAATTEANVEESALAAVAEAAAAAQADLDAAEPVVEQEEVPQTQPTEQEPNATDPYETPYDAQDPVYDVGEPGPSSSAHYAAASATSAHSQSPQPSKPRSSTSQGGPASKTAITAILGPPPKFEPARKDAKGVRSIEKHRRKTKYGLLWKSDAELEEERRRRKKGDKWLEEQKAAVRRMHEALRVGDKVVPPPEDPPLPIRSPTAHLMKPRKKRSAKGSKLGQEDDGEHDDAERHDSMEASGSARGESAEQDGSMHHAQRHPPHTTLADAVGVGPGSDAQVTANGAYEIDPTLLGEHFALAQAAAEQDLMSDFALPGTQPIASTSFATAQPSNGKTAGVKRSAAQALPGGPAVKGKRVRQQDMPAQVYFEQPVEDGSLSQLDQAQPAEDDIAPLPGSTPGYGYPGGFDIYSHNSQY